MSLKQLIKAKKLRDARGISAELTLPGEPLIYSIKYSVGQRKNSVQFFRNEQWRSLLKCWFAAYLRTHIPVVLLVRFYVTPLTYANVKASDVEKETVPAVFSWELCDYLLSFQEMLHHVLINSYRQVVKIEVDKFYSANPRTVFQFMSWRDYVDVQNNHSVHPESQSVGARQGEILLQPKRKGNATNKKMGRKSAQRPKDTAIQGSAVSNSALSNTGTPRID